MRQVPEHRWNIPMALASAVVFHTGDPEELGTPLAEHRRESKRQDSIFEGLAAKFPWVTVLDPTDLFVNAMSRCRVAEGGRALYSDNHHLTIAGAMALRPLFEPIYAGIGKSSAPVRGKSVTH